MKLYKLTDRWDMSFQYTQWDPGWTHRTTGIGQLCGPGWLHAYEDPLLAVLHNPIHANFHQPRMWVARGSGRVLREGQMKIGVTRLTTVRRMLLPRVNKVQRVAYAVLCARASVDRTDVRFHKRARAWLSGEDRTVYSIDYILATCSFDAAALSALHTARDMACSDCAVRAAFTAQYAQEANKHIDLIKLARKAMKVK